jgi:hypothetical protein
VDFRYRFVDFSTRFTAARGLRENGAGEPQRLFENEIALDVGGECWGFNTDAAVLDHHFPRPGQFPSASAAVMHHAEPLLRAFGEGGFDQVWLVSHREPDFDAFASMYLARTLIASGHSRTQWADYGLSPRGWEPDVPTGTGRRPLHWRHPDLADLPPEEHWRVLLASAASHVDQCWPMAVPRQCALHAVVYAALQRGRDYRHETSGAVELFDEIRDAIESGLNPLYDSVLERSSRFAPELQLLERDLAAYQRDLRRAARTVVYLPRAVPGFRASYEAARGKPLILDNGRVNLEPFAGDVLEPVDGIFVRDPESLLFKEWARSDPDAAPLSGGFLFTAVAYSRQRVGSGANESAYYFAIDPERAAERHLYRLWARLQAAELDSLRQPAQLRRFGGTDATPRKGYEARAGRLGPFFDDPWFDGGNYDGTIVVAPNRGTFISRDGRPSGSPVARDLGDDPVADIARRELEVACFAHDEVDGDRRPRKFTIRNLPLTGSETGDAEAGTARAVTIEDEVEPVPAGHFRFACVPLSPTLDLGAPGVGPHIGRKLWSLLHPDAGTGLPTDFLQRHLFVQRDWVGVWSRRGVVLAATPRAHATAAALEKRFDRLVRVARLIGGRLQNASRAFSEDDDGLVREVAQLKLDLALPDSHLLRRFFDATQFRDALDGLRDMQLAADTYAVAEVQRKAEWLEVFFIALYGAELMHMLLGVAQPAHWVELATLAVWPGLIGIYALWRLRPMGHRSPKPALRELAVTWLAWALLVLLLAAVGKAKPGEGTKVQIVTPPAAGPSAQPEPSSSDSVSWR